MTCGHCRRQLAIKEETEKKIGAVRELHGIFTARLSLILLWNRDGTNVFMNISHMENKIICNSSVVHY